MTHSLDEIGYNGLHYLAVWQDSGKIYGTRFGQQPLTAASAPAPDHLQPHGGPLA
jgi:hypothetical protein